MRTGCTKNRNNARWATAAGYAVANPNPHHNHTAKWYA